MRMKKLSMILFIGWSITLVLILTFGVEVARKITATVSKDIYEEKNRIHDIIMTNLEYQIEQPYELKFQMIPDSYDIEDIEYKSLTPEIFEIENGQLIGKRLSNDKNVGKILFTSKTDPKFKKEIELSFVKTYPTDCNITLSDSKNIVNKNNVYIDNTFSLKCTLTPSTVSEKQIRFEFDENYFDLVSTTSTNISLKPKYSDKKIGDYFEPIKTNIKVIVNEKLIKVQEIIINPIVDANEFESVKFLSGSYLNIDSPNQVYVNQSFYFELYGSVNKLITPFEIITDNPDMVKIDKDNIKFLKVGKVNITVKLKNGFSKTYLFNVCEKVTPPNSDDTPKPNVVIPPSISSNNFNEQGELVIRYEAYGKVLITFPENSKFTEYTYTIDGALAQTSLDEPNKITFYGGKLGTFNLTITVLTDTNPIVLNYVVKVIENENALSTISQEFAKFLAKVLGHMSFFVLQGILAIFMICHYKSKEKWLNFFIVAISGIFTAWVSEFVQFFIPGRFCSIDDIIVDLSGYIFGIIIALLSIIIVKKLKNLRKLTFGDK